MKPKDTDWVRVTFDRKRYVTRDYELALKLAKKKNNNKTGDYYFSGNKVVYYEKKIIGTWKNERFADKACTKRVRVK